VGPVPQVALSSVRWIAGARLLVADFVVEKGVHCSQCSNQIPIYQRNETIRGDTIATDLQLLRQRPGNHALAEERLAYGP
jgi:hypothetical protein